MIFMITIITSRTTCAIQFLLFLFTCIHHCVNYTYINLSIVTIFLIGISVHSVSCFSSFLCGTLPLDITLLLCTSLTSAGTSQIDSNHISVSIIQI